ncbi:MAG: hypothetical protein KKB31_05135 [Nanoarchaeota archaeon]|nr:hypothetical protein [Nanoarchaeota archaeon]
MYSVHSVQIGFNGTVTHGYVANAGTGENAKYGQNVVTKFDYYMVNITVNDYTVCKTKGCVCGVWYTTGLIQDVSVATPYFNTTLNTSVSRTVYLLNQSKLLTKGVNYVTVCGTQAITYTMGQIGSTSFPVQTPQVNWSTAVGIQNNGHLLSVFTTFARNIVSIGLTNATDIAPPPDTTPPTWDEIPQNVSIEYYSQALYIDTNATDEIALDTYFINDTTQFNITQSGELKNKTTLSIGSYYVNVSVNDTSDNVASVHLKITVDDATAPIFTQTPQNRTLEYFTDKLYIDINATDILLDTYFINDTTRFNITQSGSSNSNIKNTDSKLASSSLIREKIRCRNIK